MSTCRTATPPADQKRQKNPKKYNVLNNFARETRRGFFEILPVR